MIEPPPIFCISGMACFIPRKTPRVSTAKVRSQSSTQAASIETVAPTRPALLVNNIVLSEFFDRMGHQGLDVALRGHVRLVEDGGAAVFPTFAYRSSTALLV